MTDQNLDANDQPQAQPAPQSNDPSSEKPAEASAAAGADANAAQSPPIQTKTDQTEPASTSPESGAVASAESQPEPESEPAALDDAALAEIDQAMKQATGEVPTPADPNAMPLVNPDPTQKSAAADPSEGQPADAAPKKAIRGPRLVQGGREYRKGLIVSVGPDDIFIEFGPKELGVLPRAQFKDKEGNEPDLPKTGEEVEVAVDKYEPKESLYICSRPGAVQKAEWELLQPGQVVEATVTGVNKGGLELEVASHRAFMPASQVDVHHITNLEQFIGQKLPCQVQKVDRFGKGNIVLTRRDIVKRELAEKKDKLKDSLKVGETVDGTVKKIMPFGAFVDIGGVDALLHVSDMSHDRVRKPEDVVKEGDKIVVKVLDLDWEKDRHAVGIKQMQADPFEAATAAIEEGAEISGRVTKLMDFGCFVEVAPGTEGLVHISELDWKRVDKVSDVVQPNQVVNVRVLKIDPADRRISLSIKQTKEPPARPDSKGRGRGRGDRDDRSPDEIMKETPQLRRMREKAKQREREAEKKKGAKSGLGDLGGFGGIGLGDLKL